ncbi:MAG: MGDG synthase family glycosyltransferase [Candidatus Omnitrophota bacterium]
MDHPKKVVLLYASAGHGHEKAAKAVLEAFEGMSGEKASGAYDTLEIIPPFWGSLYRLSYYFMIKHAPWLWGFFYYLTDLGFVHHLTRRLRRFVNSTAGRALERFVHKENPAFIISTHFLSTEVASFLKRKDRIHSKLITVVTDYEPHYFWVEKGVDLYVVGLPETKEGLIKRGVPEAKIRVLGIPVEKKFLTPLSRPDVCRKLRLLGDMFTVLVTSGGAGIGAIERIAQGIISLNKPIQVIVVCGTNQWLYDRMKHESLENPLLQIFGFVTNMEELMEASDLVVGKGGGLTVTESFVKEKPVILFRSVPGQETRNASCVVRHGAGLATDSAREVVEKVSEFYHSPEKLNAMRENVKRFARPGAARAIAELADRAG